MQFPKNAKGRSFSLAYYNQRSKSGIVYRRNWLCCSPTLNVAYCEPCWVFGDRTQGSLNWVNGFNDWGHISRSMTKHESSNNHLSACLIYNKWKSDQVLDTDLDKTLKFKTKYWIKVLERVINVILTLAKNNVSFRGDNESLYDGDHNRGNFLNIIELLSIYDPVLKELLSKDKKCVKYLSPTIQNEIINLFSQ
ncbi:uncharacterized protein LOC115877776 [Sitophilus oryzae]|uniref:Uncharacterized protein LOC115877776 n=1 Tax=Sitophilus oryzae TaxID=7048 RepID=A0A6J2XG85_SITOR|nr:uncharacterized protein LOC115877776 [Sitophilus oryzae]